MRLVLASQSPRRSELLRNAGIDFTVVPAHVDESERAGETTEQHVSRLAREKALAVEGDVVLGADTVVSVDGRMLGKPDGLDDATRMLRMLSGREHQVITGVCLKHRECRVAHDTTCVWFADLSDAEIREYVATGEPLDKAGAYGIQGFASKFVVRIEGSYSNVVGLPVALVYRWLRELKPDADSCSNTARAAACEALFFEKPSA